MPERIPELCASLKRSFDALARAIATPMRTNSYRGGRQSAPDSSRASALVAKVACGLSASEMVSEYERMIESGTLMLRRPPSENTITGWMNDERLTPVLNEFLRITSTVFREREIGAMVDSSKVSQLMTAHYKEVEYNNHDKRPGADWMKCHALVGVETLVVMAVEFSGSRGVGTHDINFLKPLVETGLETFPLKFLLGDKAYLSAEILAWLEARGMRAVIPIKKGWFAAGKATKNEALMHLVKWFNANENRDFHEIYRLRPKVECLFSLLKRMAGNYCWSRGRKREVDNADTPCTAWMNEMLCKFIYLNLSATVDLEEATGVKIDYLVPSRRFLPPDEPLIKRAA
jgi:hypothetical protein